MPNLAGSVVATAFLVGVTSATVAVARDSRETLRIHNQGPNDLFIGVNGAAAVATAQYVVPNGTERVFTSYSGQIMGITAGSAWIYTFDASHG